MQFKTALAGVLCIIGLKLVPCELPSQHEPKEFSSLPIELQLHVAYCIKTPKLKDTLTSIKAFLLTNRQKSTFLADKTFTNSLLAHMQERDHHSMLECAQHMKSTASTNITAHLIQVSSACWNKYNADKQGRAYHEFVFREYENNKQLIPSLLYYILSDESRLDQACDPYNKESFITSCFHPIRDSFPFSHQELIQLWIASGLITHRKNLKNIWSNLLGAGLYRESTLFIAQSLINAGYDVNVIMDRKEFGLPLGVTRLSPTLFDYITDRIYEYRNLIGTDRTEEIVTLLSLQRMVIAAGGKSHYELQAP